MDSWIVLGGVALVLVVLAAGALLRANRLVSRILAELPPPADPDDGPDAERPRGDPQ